MTCQQVQTILENSTLSRLLAGKYTAFHQHVRRCAACQQRWNRWRGHEQQLANGLAVEPAPTDLWESILTKIENHETTDADDIIWQMVALDVSSRGLRRLVLRDPASASTVASKMTHPEPTSPLVANVYTQLAEYFRGERAVFQIPVDLHQCSDFERAVLEVTPTIPYGEVRSYTWIAAQIGRPNAARAVGNALHKNPVPLVIPCHRVVKSDGSTGGYAFGQAWKTRLLALERTTVPFIGCSATRIVCYRGCRHERRVQEVNRIHFASLQEALASGYRPCTVCRPHASSFC